MSFPPNPLNLHIWVAANHHHAWEVPILHRARAEERPLASDLLCDGKHLLHLSEPHRQTDTQTALTGKEIAFPAPVILHGSMPGAIWKPPSELCLGRSNKTPRIAKA